MRSRKGAGLHDGGGLSVIIEHGCWCSVLVLFCLQGKSRCNVCSCNIMTTKLATSNAIPFQYRHRANRHGTILRLLFKSVSEKSNRSQFQSWIVLDSFACLCGSCWSIHDGWTSLNWTPWPYYLTWLLIYTLIMRTNKPSEKATISCLILVQNRGHDRRHLVAIRLLLKEYLQ